VDARARGTGRVLSSFLGPLSAGCVRAPLSPREASRC
jgi:hypothetical protein